MAAAKRFCKGLLSQDVVTWLDGVFTEVVAEFWPIPITFGLKDVEAAHCAWRGQNRAAHA